MGVDIIYKGDSMLHLISQPKLGNGMVPYSSKMLHCGVLLVILYALLPHAMPRSTELTGEISLSFQVL